MYDSPHLLQLFLQFSVAHSLKCESLQIQVLEGHQAVSTSVQKEEPGFFHKYWVTKCAAAQKKLARTKKTRFFTFNLAFIVVPMTITIAPGLSSIVPTRSAGTSQTRHCPMISAVHTSRAKNVFLADI